MVHRVRTCFFALFAPFSWFIRRVRSGDVLARWTHSRSASSWRPAPRTARRGRRAFKTSSCTVRRYESHPHLGTHAAIFPLRRCRAAILGWLLPVRTFRYCTRVNVLDHRNGHAAPLGPARDLAQLRRRFFLPLLRQNVVSRSVRSFVRVRVAQRTMEPSYISAFCRNAGSMRLLRGIVRQDMSRCVQL